MDQMNGQSEFLRVHHFYRFVFRLFMFTFPTLARRVDLNCQSQGDSFVAQISFLTIAIHAIVWRRGKKGRWMWSTRNAIDTCESEAASQHRRAATKLLFLPAFLGWCAFTTESMMINAAIAILTFFVRVVLVLQFVAAPAMSNIVRVEEGSLHSADTYWYEPHFRSNQLNKFIASQMSQDAGVERDRMAQWESHGPWRAHVLLRETNGAMSCMCVPPFRNITADDCISHPNT